MRLARCAGPVLLCISSLVVAQQQQAPPHAPDGGTREFIQSLQIPPKPNAPFSATVTTELTKILVDGNKQANGNHRLVARDSSGRVFQERRIFMPDGDKAQTPVMELDYADPSRHELFVCRPSQKVCYEYAYNPPPWKDAAPIQAITPADAAAGGRSVKVEDLGRQTIDGVDTLGSRSIITIAQGTMGNEKEEPIVKEFWYSEQLGINVITKRFDPRFGAQNFTVGNISRGEPDPKLFVMPQDYRVVKMSAQ